MAEGMDVRLRGGGLDDLHVVRASVVEALSEATVAQVVAFGREEVDLEAVLRAEVALEVVVDGEVARTFHLVARGAAFDGVYGGAGGEEPKLRWRFELVSPIAFLALRSDVRIFQEKDAREIVLEVLAGAGLSGDAVEVSLRRSPMKRVYCVQFRETDLDFVNRLLEHEGIFALCDDSGEAAKLIVADDPAIFRPMDGGDALLLLEDRMHGAGIAEMWTESNAVPDQVSVQDYDFEQPNLSLLASEPVASQVTTDRYDYPGGHLTPDEGKMIAVIRAQELVTRRRSAHGRSDRHMMAVGRTFALEGLGDAPSRFVLLRVEHTFVVRPGDASVEDAGRPTYENRFSCVPDGTPVRPRRRTARPHVRGAHSVVVTGPRGEEIHTDPLGRLKAKHHWDRVGAEDDQASCWMRLTQIPISGSMALARTGWEMAVVYLDGDPDRPTAIGRLYNAEKVSPYGYPASASKMALQTASSPGGGKTNEVRLSDGAGGQEFFVNAAKDMRETTKNDKTETVGANETVTIGKSAQLEVTTTESVTIGGSMTTTIGGDQRTNVTADRTKTVSGSETATVTDNVTNVVVGSDTETVGGTHTTLAAMGIDRTTIGSQTLTVGGSMVTAAVMEVSTAVAGAKSETVGAAKIVASGGAIEQTCVGALAITVGGVCVQAAGGNFSSGAKGVQAVTVGGVAMANAAGTLSMKAPRISIRVAGIANLLGGGGVLTLTAGSASFAGLVKLDASGSVKIKGNPNLVG